MGKKIWEALGVWKQKKRKHPLSWESQRFMQQMQQFFFAQEDGREHFLQRDFPKGSKLVKMPKTFGRRRALSIELSFLGLCSFRCVFLVFSWWRSLFQAYLLVASKDMFSMTPQMTHGSHGMQAARKTLQGLVPRIPTCPKPIKHLSLKDEKGRYIYSHLDARGGAFWILLEAFEYVKTSKKTNTHTHTLGGCERYTHLFVEKDLIGK